MFKKITLTSPGRYDLLKFSITHSNFQTMLHLQPFTSAITSRDAENLLGNLWTELFSVLYSNLARLQMHC